MIFSANLQQVLDGQKTQTRRLVKPDKDYLVNWGKPAVFRNERLLWRVGKIYAVQPGRGKKGVAHIRIVSIRRERLQDISVIDCYAEGTVEFIGHKPIDETEEGSGSVNIREHFGRMWDSIHPQGSRWEDNPEVWVLVFELCEVGEAGGP